MRDGIDEIDPLVKKHETIRDRRNKIRNEIENLALSEFKEWTVVEFMTLLRVIGIGMNSIDLPSTRDLEMVEKQIELQKKAEK